MIEQTGGGRGLSMGLEDDDAGLASWQFGGEQGGAMSMAVLLVEAHGHKRLNNQSSICISDSKPKDSQPWELMANTRPIERWLPNAAFGEGSIARRTSMSMTPFQAPNRLRGGWVRRALAVSRPVACYLSMKPKAAEQQA